ncbi:restriction endonuclease subunit S [Pseudoalteromonas sp. 1181_04]|uniref:restriction endonuclease subunit S n=1 Tax=Pseudoalteromonas sp. 1181_04 TaxID=2604450 RepID=UPI004063FA67
MQRYDNYKNSGIEWLGEIPDSWIVKRLKRFARICNGKDHKGVWDVNGKYPIIGSGGFFGKASEFLYDKPSVLLGRKGTIDKPLFIEEPFWSVDTAYYTDIFDNTDKRFFYYLCMTINFELYKYGSAVPSMNQEVLSQIPFCSPPQGEQTAIANYLDRKTAEIDKLIKQKQQLITLYQEEKAALINQAVTKGLNSNVKMKDSGIEWLGEIPDSWKIKRLRYAGNCKNGVSAGAEFFGSGHPFVNYTDVYKSNILPHKVAGLALSTESDRKLYSIEYGDVLFTRTSETVEEIGLASTCLKTIKDSIFAGFLIRFRPSPELLNPEFSKYYFSCSLHRRFFVKEMNLVTRASLSQELLKRMPVVIPTSLEQREIADFLDKSTLEIEFKITKTKRIIELQQEYRTALISEAVTGKFKVPELVEKEFS